MSLVETTLKQTSEVNANMLTYFCSTGIHFGLDYLDARIGQLEQNLFVFLLFACMREREGGSEHGKGRAKILKHVPPASASVCHRFKPM